MNSLVLENKEIFNFVEITMEYNPDWHKPVTALSSSATKMIFDS